MSDRIAVMRSGRFEQIGAKTEIYTNPASAFVATFVGMPTGWTPGSSGSRASWRGSNGAGGTLLVPRPQDAGQGANVCYFVKHEDLQIDLAASTAIERSGVNRLTGVLRDIIFKGQTANYIVALPTGEDLIVSGTPQRRLGESERPGGRLLAGGGGCLLPGNRPRDGHEPAGRRAPPAGLALCGSGGPRHALHRDRTCCCRCFRSWSSASGAPRAMCSTPIGRWTITAPCWARQPIASSSCAP